MIPNDQPARVNMIERMLNHLLLPRQYNTLTEWEANFISSIKTQFDTKSDLSQRQCEILERIYDK